MWYSDLRRRKRKILIIIITILGSLSFTFPIHAETISPSLTEEFLTAGANTSQIVTITNDSNYDIYITPHVYKYYPQSEYISEPEPFEEFVKMDTDYITVPANNTKDIYFQITAPYALESGTYYNLIIFQQTEKTKTSDPKIGASGALSHLVRLYIVEDSTLTEITEDYDIGLEVVEKGIPFIKPVVIKFTFFNNSQYTLIPQGEIQVVKKSKDKEPEYLKINIDRTKVFPEQSFKQEFEVENWYLEDILFGKTAYLKIENGLDENIRTEEIEIPGFKNELLYILSAATVIILLIVSLRKSSRLKQESSE